MSSINQSEFETTLFSEPKTRRQALKTIASGMTVATLSGCVGIRKPKQKITTYTNEPEHIIPGEPNYYATSCEINSDVNGLIVTSHEGRPTKIEGNPRHPNTKGKSTALIQAEIHELYDPDRLKSHLTNKKSTPFASIKNKLSNEFVDDTMAIVLPSTSSLTTQALLNELKKNNPNVNIYYINPINSDNSASALAQATGTYGYINHDFSKTSFILSFNHDFLGIESTRVSQLSEYIQNQNHFNHISYSSSLTITDSKAHAIVSSSIREQEHTLNYIAHELSKKYGTGNLTTKNFEFNYEKQEINIEKTKKAISFLIKHRSKSIVSAGEIHSTNVHKLVLFINSLLKNIGQTTHVHPNSIYEESYLSKKTFNESILDIKKKLATGALKTIISLDVDLTRHLPENNIDFNKTKLYYLTTRLNNFATIAHHVISKTHFLEDWDILISKEGHTSIQQPLIKPLYNGKTIADILLILNKSKQTTTNFITQLIQKKTINFNELKKYGVIPRKSKQKTLLVKTISLEKKLNKSVNPTLIVYPSYQMLDGRYSNNSWLHETPDPISKLTWGNAFYFSSSFAKNLDVKTGNIVKINLKNNKVIKGPIIIIPGQHTESVTISYGYGRIFNTTFSAYGTSTDHLSVNKHYDIVSIEKTEEHETLADTQMNHGLDEEPLAASGIKNRIEDILKIKSLNEINHPAHDKSHEPHSLFKELTYTGEYQWGMSIDLNACIGCNACSIACQAENNIPIVGKEEVIKGREMSWIRIDRYFMNNSSNETTINFMPVACVHCENAPCEQVCPVNATVHDDEGLNVMTYNRCVGTRYCANNCPYKVRRFNFFDWHQKNPQSTPKNRIHLFDYFKEPSKQTQHQFNPDVTIRMRGVMEKCSYCIQRISQAKIKDKVEQSSEAVNNLKTACQQACPTDAIVFGDIKNPSSKITEKRKSKRRYDLLQKELNTKPRTTYLAKIKKDIWKKEKTYGHH
jgi:Fe-S-cluster-containing dehydrogenase component